MDIDIHRGARRAWRRQAGRVTAGPALAIGLVLSVLLAAMPAAAQDRLAPTTPTNLGPWYQPGAAEVERLRPADDPGPPLDLRGRVLDVDAQSVADVLIEYWHTDSGGNYPPLRASTRSGADGSFVMRTVLPGQNLGYRARHIHFVLSHTDYRQLVTRIYFRGDENMDEAPWPELAITLEEVLIDATLRYVGNVRFVLRPQ